MLSFQLYDLILSPIRFELIEQDFYKQDESGDVTNYSNIKYHPRFNEYLQFRSSSEIVVLIGQFDKAMQSLNTLAEKRLKIEEIYSNLDSYIERLSKSDINEEYPFLKLDLEQLKINIYNKYKNLFKPNENLGIVNISNSPKIKWNAGVASLATMFSELTNLKISKGDPYISNTPKEIIDLILANFVGYENEMFDKETLGRYLLDKPSKKSAKTDKVDLDKILPKED